MGRSVQMHMEGSSRKKWSGWLWKATDGLEYEGSSSTELCRMAMEDSSSTEPCRMYMESNSCIASNYAGWSWKAVVAPNCAG